MLLVTGCGTANKSTGLSNSSAASGEIVDRGAAIADSGTSQVSKASGGQAGAPSASNAAKSPEKKTSEQTVAANSASAPSTNSQSSSVTSGAGQAPASSQASGMIAAGVSRQPGVAQPSGPVKPTVTISISCQTAVNKGLASQEKFQGVVPVNGVILPPTTVEITDGETVIDVLKQVTRAHKIPMEYEGFQGTTYVQGINSLYEFDAGPLSGWLYFVNKQPSNSSCGIYKLKSGDVIDWLYTCDLGKDLGQNSFPVKK